MKWPPWREGAWRAPVPKLLLNSATITADPRPAQACDPVPLICANAPPDELWVLTRPLGTTDPIWGEQYTIIGSPERIRSLFDLSSGIPWPWRLLKNKKARRFLRDSLKQELRYRRDKSSREKAGDN